MTSKRRQRTNNNIVEALVVCLVGISTSGKKRVDLVGAQIDRDDQTREARSARAA